MSGNLTYDRAAAEMRRPISGPGDPALEMRELVRFATLAASSHNTQPWRFRISPGAITVLPDFARRCPVVDVDDAHLWKSLGCAAENLVQAAPALGYAAAVFADESAGGVTIHLERSASFKPGELFPAIPLRQCTRSAYDRRDLGPEPLKLLERSAEAPGVRLTLLTTRTQMEAALEYINSGNRIQLSDPAFRQEFLFWIRFNAREALRTGDGLAGRTSGQPSLPRWLGKRILRFVLTAKSQEATDARNLRSSSALAVFVSARDDKAAWIEVGRAYERFALQATALGIRNAFLNQPIEVRSLRPQFESWLGLKGEKASLMVRIGYAPLAPYSLRRRLDDVLV
jgi:hypothetical protein